MATLNILNSFSITINGVEFSGKQGLAADSVDDAFGITVDGKNHVVAGQLATATVITVYDDDDDLPADFDYLFLWADQKLYLQLIAGSTSVVIPIAEKQPFVLPGFDAILAAASATLIAGGTEPVCVDIDSVALGNYSGTTANFLFAVID